MCWGFLAKLAGLFFGRGGASNAVAVAAEGLELVDELVDNVPGPVVGGCFDLDGSVGVEDVVEKGAVVVVGLESVNVRLAMSIRSNSMPSRLTLSLDWPETPAALQQPRVALVDLLGLH